MSGPEHYRQGEHLLARCTEFREGEHRSSIAVEAQAHFLAALTAAVATSQHPESIAWQQAINPKEQT